MLYKRRFSKWITIIILILLGITAIALIISLHSLEKKHEEEIRKVISSNGGKVMKIERVDPNVSPFAEDSNKSNVIYKVTYSKSKAELVAWYRGVSVVNNIHGKNPTALLGGYEEKWIIPSDSSDF
ncbi:hypothetical protein ACYEXS_36430 [Paenibacillus sp. MAH-36]|uniref:DUF3139 domain-containing protein n=1 Tax=Paenibacillus violae TaxID=3077234 RepID=A0ABU3RI62_9BACL|nr:hypothetical protein [Paenibacillus sp. PFR10]MDU0203970.1 hypothetical protein [Paenibacillus sp. PFR10]